PGIVHDLFEKNSSVADFVRIATVHFCDRAPLASHSVLSTSAGVTSPYSFGSRYSWISTLVKSIPSSVCISAWDFVVGHWLVPFPYRIVDTIADNTIVRILLAVEESSVIVSAISSIGNISQSIEFSTPFPRISSPPGVSNQPVKMLPYPRWEPLTLGDHDRND
ncbi:7581_t:CDS:2, partial [Paraglomus brasilianum]